MTPAFEHHDKIAALPKGAWLRVAGVIDAHYTERIVLSPGTLLRVVACPGELYVEYDAGGPIKTAAINPEWFYRLTVVDEPSHA